MKTDQSSTGAQLCKGFGTARFLSPALVAGMVLLALAAPSLRATPVYAGIGVDVSAAQSGVPVVYGSDHATGGGAGSTLNVSTTASLGGATSFAHETATWAPDGNSGTIATDYGWSIRVPPAVFSGVGTGEGGPNWEYSFVADATGDFVLNYQVTGTGDTLFGLQGFRIGEHGYFALGHALVDDAHPSVSGQYIFAVTQGGFYDFQFVNLGNIYGPIQILDASVHAEFSWTLPGAAAPSVPESSSSVALLGLGFGGLMLARRRMGEQAVQP